MEKVQEAACWVCEIETTTRRVEEELRQALRLMNPQTDPRYYETFERFIYENQTFRMIRGQLRAANRKKK